MDKEARKILFSILAEQWKMTNERYTSLEKFLYVKEKVDVWFNFDFLWWMRKKTVKLAYTMTME